MAKITYLNKVKIQDIPVAEINKFTDANANEIKSVVNDLDDIKQNKLVEGDGIIIDDTDPLNPIITSTGGGITDHTILTNIGTNTHAQIDTALTRLENTSGNNTGDQDLSGYEILSNKKTDVETNKTSNVFYPSIKAVYDWAVGKFQSILVSGTNIKTVNGASILGGGNLTVTGASQNLQQVTDIGNVTSNIIKSTNTIESVASATSFSRITSQGFLYLSLLSTHAMSIIGFQGKITSRLNSANEFTLQFPTSPASTYTQNLQSKSGTIALLDDITGGATHPVYTARNITATGASVLSTFTSDTIGSVTGITTRTLTPSNIGAESSLGNPTVSGNILSSTTAGVRSWVTPTNYTHPSYTAKNISATGASVLSTFTSDTIGSVTGITTRTLTPSNIGAESSLGNPTVSGNILSSTTAGVRSWITPPTGGATNLSLSVNNLVNIISSDTGTDVSLNASTDSVAGLMTASTQTIGGAKTFNNNVTALSFIKSGGTSSQYLMANGTTTSRPYASYVAILNQFNTDAPIATVLQNELGGTVVWTRIETGVYHGTLAGKFISNKTVAQLNVQEATTTNRYVKNIISTNYIQISTHTNTGALVDNAMNTCFLEIRVYP